MSYIGGPLPEVDEEDKEEGKLGTETLNQFGEWFSNTEYGKRFKAGQERNAALEQTIIDQGGPASLAFELKNKPNELEQNLLKGISDVTNIDERITTPATYLALSGGVRGLSKLKPKHLGISQSISKIKTLPEPTVARSLINVTEGQSIFSMPKVTGVPKPKGLLRKYQNPKGGEVYDPNVFISKAEMSAMLNTMTVDGAEGYGLFSVKPASDLDAIGDLNLIPNAGALYGKMNRQGKAGKESGERIASKFASPLEITQFNKKYGEISRRQPGAAYTSPFAPHHLAAHEDAARINIRGDAEQVWTEINNLSPRKHTPGNVRENLIGAMHRKNAAFIQSGKESIIQQKPEWVQTSKPYTWNDPYLGELTSTPDRILKDIIKDPGDAPYPSEIKSLSSIGLPESGVWPSGNKVTPKQKAVAWKERFDYWGIDRKQVKFDPKGDIIGVDHVEIGHAAIKLHPKYKEMQELLNNRDLYLSKSAKEAAAIIEPGLRVAENVFININKLRLDLIKEHLGFLTRTGIDKNGRPKFKSNPTIVKQYLSLIHI